MQINLCEQSETHNMINKFEAHLFAEKLNHSVNYEKKGTMSAFVNIFCDWKFCNWD